ncbi:nuclear transport factor 2 family protein [Caulobacter sp. 17J65-9]|uniref:nuclear transport factor 2 family protein n=1 Tax=Caulobacter sp. 17J65-9 TaxID=2709382 RepID=UPI0013C70E3B|nr:nuclear transport factor 2 family protein [Caulobacter sp. 17J65-9]NEX91238.1 nuclear transport factor 2 family protein [Caulobacter sp. 17J65-9]
MLHHRSAAGVAALMLVLGLGAPAVAHDGHDKKPAAAAPTVPGDPAIQEASAAVDAFHSALARGDTAAAAAAFADDALIFEQGYVERSKAEYAGHHLPADAAYAQATKYTLISRGGLVSGELAYVVSEGRTVGRYKDKDVDQLTLETAVLRRSHHGWQIVHVHWSSRSAPAKS